MAKVSLDPGHGGKDPGGIGSGLQEKDLALQISLKTAALLKAKSIEVILTRTTDRYIDLTSERTPACDISISIHVNRSDPPGTGLETWVSIYNSPKLSTKLGQVIQSNILKRVAFRDRGLKTQKNSKGNADYLYMLRNAKGVPVLVECGFINNPTDAKILKAPGNLDKIAEGIANGIFEYLGIKTEPEKIDLKGVIKTKVLFEKLVLDGYIIDGKTCVELRKLCEAIRLKVIWDERKFQTEVKR